MAGLSGGKRSIARFAIAAAVVWGLTGCASPDLPNDPGTPIIDGDGDASGTGEVILLEDLTDRQVLPASNWWNLDVSTAPLDPDSDAYIDWISGRTPQNPTATRR
ncbi:MAG: hypothetical protein KC729_15745, partial [Candidatus Eisenbacteria bacterium]|nr:hypothetical protein [Candidatus Eisenbacteria bacterium]